MKFSASERIPSVLYVTLPSLSVVLAKRASDLIFDILSIKFLELLVVTAEAEVLSVLAVDVPDDT